MKENKYLTKFEPENYIKGDDLISESEPNITICGHTVTFSNLEFDEKVKINTYCLVLSQDEKCKTIDNEIYRFQHHYQDGVNTLEFEKMDYDFSGCKFNDEVHFNLPENCAIDVAGSIFEEHFYINNEYYFDEKKISINQIRIKNSVFKRDFCVYKACINEIEIENVDFQSLSEFNEVEFKNKFNLSEITYKDFSLFDKCIFHTKAQFEYIIFEKFTSFRESVFKNGINLDYTSSDKEIHFFGIKGLDTNSSKENTSQETYRTIKHNFEKLGNKIEANKYHGLELDQQRRKLEKDKFENWREYFVFKLHDLSSEHSTNWFLPISWVAFIGFMSTFAMKSFLLILIGLPTVYLFVAAISNDKSYRLMSSLGLFTVGVFLTNIVYENYFSWSDVVKNMSLISLETMVNGANVQSRGVYDLLIIFLNKIFLGYLYYQFLMSVRKDTRK
ncbi:MAG: hypothetical protein ACI9TV_002276 [Sulfurimonas sp.]|jgi:hypothetical protein|uniref:hypothetical protein n=1 Tax=Sulfurimonas sp. TaxID=2022749 RepID=UPI0039E38D1A